MVRACRLFAQSASLFVCWHSSRHRSEGRRQEPRLPQPYRGQVAEISSDAAEFAVNFQAIRNGSSADAGGQMAGKNEMRLAFGLRDHLNDPFIPGRFCEIKVCGEVLYFLCCCSAEGLEPFDGFIDDHLSLRRCHRHRNRTLWSLHREK